MIADEYEKLQEAVLSFIQKGEGTFEELALAIHAFQFRKNAPYQRFCRLRGVDEALADWTQIPAVPQQAFKSSRLTTFPMEMAVREFRTSGTTGEGFGSHYFRDLTLYDAAIEAGWSALKVDHLTKLVLTPSPEEAPHSSLSHMMGRLAQNESSCFYMRCGILEEKRLRNDIGSEPVLLLGTALAFFNLMEKANMALTLPAVSHILETGGYKGSGRSLSKEDFYGQLSEFFGVELDSILNEYGMTELSSQFYTHGLGRPHLSGPWIRERVVHPLTGREVAVGETGILQLFDLANIGSVLAIQTEDLAVRQESGFILLGRDPAALARGCSRSADDQLNR
ncbi:MAG: acyl-protein synthetase [Chthoniobacterales bacterium]